MMTNPTIPWSSSTRTPSFDLGSEPSPRAMGTAAGADGAFAVRTFAITLAPVE
jgi:hypothetical protein